jgi:hemoglobin
MSVYDAIGGPRMVRTTVDVLYRRLLADPQVRPYFDGVDLGRLSAHQRAFLSAALGGPNLYGGRDMAAAHEGLGIDDAAFDALAEHLIATLRDLGADPEAVRVVVDRIETFRDAVVGKSP